MVIYNALPRKEYERICMFNTEKEIWKTLLITHQGNNQVKDNKIDLLVQQYEQFVIFEDESKDNAFARFNTISTSLKDLDEGYCSKNYVRNLFRALHLKWRAKVMAKESKDLTSLSLDELIRNLKVHEMIIKKDSEIVKAKGEIKSLSLKAKKESSDEECLTSGNEDEEYAMAVLETSRSSSREKSDSGEEDDEKAKNEMCLVAQASNEVCSDSSYFSDENSSVDDLTLDNDEITKDGKVIGRCIRNKGLYVMKLGNKPEDKICLATIDENFTLWHRRLGHANIHLIQSLASKKLVRELSKLKFDQHFCDACKIRKQAHASHKAKNIVLMTRCLELLHMDLFGPFAIRSYEGNLYTLFIVDDYSRLVAQGYNPQEGIDYDETYAPVATLESIRIILAYAYALDFKLFQIDVKSAFLNDFINEEVYVAQPPEFIDIEKPIHVYILKKALYGLKQAPKAWPYIMFSVCHCAHFQEAPKTSHLEAVKRIFRYIKGTTHLGLCYPKGTGIETVVYADSDHTGDYVDRNSTICICMFVGYCLTSWFSKKQTALAISTIKSEYVNVGKACQQALWMKQVLINYDIRLDDVLIMCDNNGAIDLSKNPVQHSRTKHIEIRYHFLHDNVQKGHISIEKAPSVDNIADILTKPLKRESVNYLRLGLGMIEHIS
nr:copia protein [Tanacetum cinerariifolium]